MAGEEFGPEKEKKNPLALLLEVSGRQGQARTCSGKPKAARPSGKPQAANKRLERQAKKACRIGKTRIFFDVAPLNRHVLHGTAVTLCR